MPLRSILVALLALLAAGCSSRKPEDKPFHLVFTADTSGRIEPCGCFSGQFGGLTRISTFLKSGGTDPLKVEIGNAIAGLEDYNVVQFRHLLDAFHAMGYSAVNFGEREARLPAATIRELAATSPVPLLSANILDAETGKPLLAPSIVGEFNGLKVGFVGAVDPESLIDETDPSVRVAEMGESIRRALDGLKDKADIRVCIAFTDENGLEKIAREFYEFALILGGDVTQPSSTLTKVNQSYILATTNEARALGIVRAVFNPATDELNKVSGDIQLMVDTIPQDPAIRQFSTNYRDEIRKVSLEIDRPAEHATDRVPGVESRATYVGSQACAACHAKAYEIWSKSLHSRAFETLAEKNSDADPSCIRCHVVGFGEPGGYRRSMGASSALTGVGCESCHGPASEHVRLRSETPHGEEILVKMRPVGQGQCIQCHYGEFSRPFKWDEFWPLIAH